jgi:hypothetical protein
MVQMLFVVMRMIAADSVHLVNITFFKCTTVEHYLHIPRLVQGIP